MNYRHTFTHNLQTYKCAHPHTCSHTLSKYNLRTLKKTSSILYVSSIFFIWIQPFLGNGWNFFCYCCFVQCSLSFHWKLLPNLTFTVNIVLHTNHMNKSSHILVFAMVKGESSFFIILKTILDFILYITIFILWIVNESHAQKKTVTFHIS
jgi:hypothetical protein